LASLVGVFNSTADIWVNYVFVAYSFCALICPTGKWEETEPGLNPIRWRANPTLVSTYAWLLVLIQFTVYFYAGINKLVFGWTPWTTGMALQNLAVDDSMREFAMGMYVPHWISFILCYFTVFQRLIVPFGFYFRRLRLWSALILISMHMGYAILMKVEIFPLIGIASLLIILPPKNAEEIPSLKIRKNKKNIPPIASPLFGRIALGIFFFWLLLEPIRLTFSQPTPWENKLMIIPAWRMFADGGVTAGGKWRLVLDTPRGEVDATNISHQLLPHLWRDRFYINLIYHELLNQNSGSGSLPEKLAKATEESYSDHQRQLNADPIVLDSGFDVSYRKLRPKRDAGGVRINSKT